MKDGELIASLAHWEFLSARLRSQEDIAESRKKYTTLNAKAENLFVNDNGQKSMWADAALKRRCLVPSTGFYEWCHFKPKGEKKEIAYPYFITVNDSMCFYLAGTWTPWTDKSTGETIDTFAIVTTEGNSLMSQAHNKKKRMPTILPENLAAEWLKEGNSEQRISEIARYQMPTEKMSAYTISKDFREMETPRSYSFTKSYQICSTMVVLHLQWPLLHCLSAKTRLLLGFPIFVESARTMERMTLDISKVSQIDSRTRCDFISIKKLIQSFLVLP